MQSPQQQWSEQQPANTDALTVAERIQALRRATAAELVSELRGLLYPLLTETRLCEGNAPLVLRLLKLRLDAGNLAAILALRRHPQIYAHKDIVFVLKEHDADYLELKAVIVEKFRRMYAR